MPSMETSCVYDGRHRHRPTTNVKTMMGETSPPLQLPSPPLGPHDLKFQGEGPPDIELAYPPFSRANTDISENDPLLLKTRIHPETEMNRLRRRRSRKDKGIHGFYATQNAHITKLLKPIEVHADERDAAQAEDATRVKIAITGSLIANCCLAVLQIYAAASSLSLSFFATAIDAIFDPLANFVLNWLHRKADKVDLKAYPSGGSRLVVIGNIVYSFVMGSVSVILVAFSIQSLVRNDDNDRTLHIPAVVAVAVAFVTKLMLFFYCYSIRGSNSQVRVLWQDHRNDVFINGLGIFTSSAGSEIKWWIDPLGAIVISLILIYLWGSTVYEQFSFLAGKSAPADFLQLVIYKAMTFSEQIEKIDSCRAYHAGEDYVVEVDVVMPSETPLWKAHDISQDLQDKLETLPGVDRAFVHVDHEIDHRPEHRKKFT